MNISPLAPIVIDILILFYAESQTTSTSPVSENQADPSTEDTSVKTQGKRDENKSPAAQESSSVTDKIPVEKTAAETTASQNDAGTESNQKPSAERR